MNRVSGRWRGLVGPSRNAVTLPLGRSDASDASDQILAVPLARFHE
jgi:hypothetical protein